MMKTFLLFLENFTLSIDELTVLTQSSALDGRPPLDIEKNFSDWSVTVSNHILCLQSMSVPLAELVTELHELIKLELEYDVTVVFNSVVQKMLEMFNDQKQRLKKLVLIAQERLAFNLKIRGLFKVFHVMKTALYFQNADSLKVSHWLFGSFG